MLRRNHTLAVGRPTHAGTAPVHRPDEEHFPKVTRPIVHETLKVEFEEVRKHGASFVMLRVYCPM
jgi:hypothetical protein